MLSFSYDKEAFGNIKLQILAAPQAIVEYALAEIPAVMQREITPLTTEPSAPSLPFIWSTDPVKQRKAQRWYFKNKVKRGSSPGRHLRTHALINKWQTTGRRTSGGAEIVTENDMPGLEFVQGPQQVPSHQTSGWERYEIVLPQAREKAINMITDKWLHTLD